MRRAEFLRLTGLTVDNLKNFVRRDCVPFAVEAQDETTAYDYRQAFATRLAIRLGDYLDLRQAKLVVENYLDAFVAKFGNELIVGKQIFFGYGMHLGPNGNDVGLVAGPLGGLLESVIVDSADGRFAEFALVALGSRKPRLTQVALVDAGAEFTEFRESGGNHALALEWIKSVKASD